MKVLIFASDAIVGLVWLFLCGLQFFRSRQKT